MKTVKVIAAGWSSEGKSMGDLVDEGIMEKSYETSSTFGSSLVTPGSAIIWHLKENAGVIVDNGFDVMPVSYTHLTLPTILLV